MALKKIWGTIISIIGIGFMWTGKGGFYALIGFLFLLFGVAIIRKSK